MEQIKLTAPLIKDSIGLKKPNLLLLNFNDLSVTNILPKHNLIAEEINYAFGV